MDTLESAAAHAASGAEMAVKAPVYKAPAAVAYSWTGLYLGGNVGYSWDKADAHVTETLALLVSPLTFTIPDIARPNGITGGAQIGYNAQVSPDWVVGIEADWQGSAQQASRTLPSQAYFFFGIGSGAIDAAYDAKIAWFGTVRGRIGHAWNKVLIYATGGLAYGEIKIDGTVTDSCTRGVGPVSSTAPFTGSKVSFGWSVGGGIETVLAQQVSAKVEYLHLDLGSLDASSAGPFGTEPIITRTRFTDNIVHAGLNFKFDPESAR